MKNITFISTQDQQIFTANNSSDFVVSGNKHCCDERSSWIFLDKLLLPMCADESFTQHRTDRGQLFCLCCSLVCETTIFNSSFCNLYKLFCLTKDEFIVNFKRADYLPLHTTSVSDVIAFEIGPFVKSSKNDGTPVSVTPTLASFFQQSENSLPALNMSTWDSDQYKIVLDSSDQTNVQYRKNNNGCDFDIQLPRPIELGDQRWELELNSLFIHKHVFSIFPLVIPNDKFVFTITTVHKKKIGEQSRYSVRRRTGDLKAPDAPFQTFQSALEIVNYLNDQIKPYSRQQGRAKFMLNQAAQKIVWQYDTRNLTTDDPEIVEVFIAVQKEGLGQLLGFIPEDAASTITDPDWDDDDDEDEDVDDKIVNDDEFIVFSLWQQSIQGLPNRLQRAIKTRRVADWNCFQPVDEKSIFPRNILVTCNLIKNSCIGNKFVRVLRIINTKENFKNPYVIAADFDHSMPIEMDVKSFHSIHIQLCDTNGHPVPSNKQLVPETGSVGEEKIHTVIEMTLKKCDI